jgi:FMN phosphatase YigB (HAD superfamily)
LASRFVHIYHSGNTTHLKPDPRAFKNLFEVHDLNASECVYVGDSPSDAVAANKAGMKFIACFESGLRTSEDFAHVTVDSSIQKFVDLPAAITSI